MKRISAGLLVLVFLFVFFGCTPEVRSLGTYNHTNPKEMQMLSVQDGYIVNENGEHIVLKDLNLRFRGSSNQRLIDVPKSLESGETILWEDWQGDRKGMI